MIFVIILLITICLVLLSSNTIIDNYYPIATIVYIVINIWYLSKYKKNQLICAELFFAISFYLCSFLSPTLLQTLSSVRFYISETPITIFRSYTIALIGYLFYMLGLILVRKNKAKTVEETINIIIPKDVNNAINILTSFFIVLMLLNGGISLYSMYRTSNLNGISRFDGFGSYMTYSTIAYMCSIMTNFLRIKRDEKMSVKEVINGLSPLFLINSLFLILSFLISGYRSQAIQLILPILFIYSSYIREIKLKKLLIIFLCGFILLSYIGFTRDGSQFNIKDISFIYYFRDFFSANSANVFLIEYSDLHGPAFSNVLFQVLSIIPGLQGVVSMFINTSKLAPSSSLLYTGYYNTGSGLGTGIIGDLYYSFGFFGMMLSMFALGLFLSFLNKRFKRNPYVLIALLVFIGNSVFMARVEFFYIVRTISFAIIIFFLVSIIVGRQKSLTNK